MTADFIQLATNEFFVNEGSGEVIISLEKVDDSDGEATAIYSTINGTATEGNGNDYLGSDQGTVLVVEDGETLKTVTIPILEDDKVEGDKTFSFLIGQSTGAELGEPRTATITIEDNDIAQETTVAFAQSSFSVDESEEFATITLVKTVTSTAVFTSPI